MIKLGTFFYRYRNILFITLYAGLFIPSRPILSDDGPHGHYNLITLIVGLGITFTGQLIRGLTIGLAYIIRGGKDGKVYADKLVTRGIFQHCRNPLYLGNVLMLAGVGIMANSLLYVAVFIPAFLLIYHSIVLAEENFLRTKFGDDYIRYCSVVSRWGFRIAGLGSTLRSMKFNWRRWIIKEYNTQYIWLTGIVLILFLKYPQLVSGSRREWNFRLFLTLSIVLMIYLLVRYLKKSGQIRE